jgi:hypothetical protein
VLSNVISCRCSCHLFLSHAHSDLLTTLNLDLTQLLPLVGSDIAKRVLKNHVLQVCAANLAQECAGLLQ